MKNILAEIFDGKKIAILGFGREGQSTYKLLRSIFPKMLLTICDASADICESAVIANDTNIRILTGKNYQNTLQGYDLIIKSPGVKLNNAEFLKDKITSQTDIFLKIFGHQTIGITGTKGKSTTSTLTNFILNESGLKSVLLGNIGIPAFDMLERIDDNTIIVYELSAHQLEYTNHSPHIGILLNIFPEHLDYFDGYEKYRSAKLKIADNQDSSDLLIINSGIEYLGVQEVSIISKGVSCVSNLKLKGDHNRKNAMFAFTTALNYGVNPEKAKEIIARFPGLPHRLEFVCERDGIVYYNDSISTIPQSAIAAVKALENVDTIILGGYDRGIDYQELVNFLTVSVVSNFIFLGMAGNRIMGLFPNEYYGRLFLSRNLEEAVVIAKSKTAKGKICLLSPAAASYDQFYNFEHRGDMFKELCKSVK